MACEELCVKYFRDLVENEINYLKKKSQKWNEEKENADLNEDIIGDINVCIGQSELLIREKFGQFQTLIDDCELKRGEKEVTLQDLQGFWDIINIQLLKIKEKFDNLTKLKDSNWIVDSKNFDSSALKRKPLGPQNDQIPKKKKRFEGKSNVRQHIEAARKKMQDKQNHVPSVSLNEEKNEIPKESVSPKVDNIKVSICNGTPQKDGFLIVNKEFDAGFFMVQTPIKSCTPPNRKRGISLGTPKVLSSSLLKEQIKESPFLHKDYSPCTRVTRSMKKQFKFA